MSADALESPVKIMGANLSPGKNNTVEVLCGKKVQQKLWQKNFLSKSRNQNNLKQLQKENFGCLKRKEDNVNVSPFFKCPYVFSSPKQGLTALSNYRPNLFCSLQSQKQISSFNWQFCNGEIATLFCGNREKFIFVHQRAWQRFLLMRNEIASRNATYGTIKYALPLFSHMRSSLIFEV